ncbi:SUMF1/EgtB/PvdO family nonheme iron enzyme [Streptomyces sp. NPDC059679]|uniref:SUMF1/EgtB/PvdO family nonheme iron enzyme n=1 Tax=Streptomyces sp. NPDC059679 TaxID=3346903 RepID=UPI0036963B02
MTLVTRWTGVETRALRLAKRMTIEAFAEHLGVSDRMVSKWESGGGDVVPRQVNQAALDTSLACSNSDVQGRFASIVATPPTDAAAVQPAPDLQQSQHVRHPVDGKLMTKIGEGVFMSGSKNEPQWLESYYIDVFPVTNADYARFVAATGHPAPRHWEEKGRCSDRLWDHPVVWVTWRDAATYAAWAGKALPSSHQWEKAARGTAGAIYPWGDQPTVAKCNVRESGIGETTPVSRYHSGVSPLGVYDMCGNTWEWCSTETEPGRYELKGSAFTSPFFRCVPAEYNDASIDMYDDDTGFRCVALCEQMEARH